MFSNNPRLYFVLVSALLLCQSTASAKTQMGKPHHTVYTMSVDYNPDTEQLTGLCRVNGHPCWLLLDTGWFGVALFTDRQADWKPGKAKPQKTQPGEEQSRKNNVRARASVRLGPLDFFPDDISVDIVDDTKHHRTSTGHPITGIIGIPFLNIIPTEWDVPHRKVVFWLQGRPKQFRHVPPRAIVVCKQEEDGCLVPISVHGKHSEVYFDTGSDEIYLFDNLISDFPAFGPKGVVTGPELGFNCVPRSVEGLTVGPMTLGGTMGGILPGDPKKGKPPRYGSMGMSIISHLHFFVVGYKIIFDPASGHFSNQT